MTVSDADKPHHVEQADLDDALDHVFSASDPPSRTGPAYGVVSAPAPLTEEAVLKHA